MELLHLEQLKSYENTQVIMFSSQPEEVYAISTLKAGASGYINKGADLNIVKEAIFKVNRGETYLSDSLRNTLFMMTPEIYFLVNLKNYHPEK